MKHALFPFIGFASVLLSCCGELPQPDPGNLFPFCYQGLDAWSDAAELRKWLARGASIGDCAGQLPGWPDAGGPIQDGGPRVPPPIGPR